MTALPLLSPADITILRQEAASAQCRMIDLLVDRHGSNVLVELSVQLQLRSATATELLSCTPDLEALRFEECLRRECVAVRDSNNQLLIAVCDPFDAHLQDWLGARILEPFQLVLTSCSDMTACLARIEEDQHLVANMIGDAQNAASTEHTEDISARRISEDASPVVKLVNSTLYDALKQNASDIHLESLANGMQIKYRVDGVLNRVGAVQGADLAEQAISRIKVMAELDIAERRVPQDGRFKANAGGREIDFRVSIMPSIHGEDAVLRVLDKEHLTQELSGLTLSSLGFDDTTRAQLRHMANEPYGMLLVTGPTGSGKTTTLYATIGETNHGLDKIVTIEDPVEYQLPGVLQIPVNEKKGLTFARGLRSILRHDPDKIMVGEIRDPETAEIAVQAALTGHLVFTTVHANNVFDVIGRFMHMGLDPYNLVAALNVIVAQRLLRINCPHCSSDIKPDAALLAESRLGDTAGYRFRAGTGCGQCRGSGYRGRRAIAEILMLNDELRELITQRAPLRTLKETAARYGFQSLRNAGMALVAAGESTLQELNRVTFVA
ncbi:GspE/PulE family protein [Uliginosibacterium sp. 31-16]|uniref:GspE/PulE family protein n=1 Tax=Uliginosibacterium sp. 31-16 TaxID=3068315 RepID=UPI00273DAE7C|nr:GspE/PulE family protein [Uliginosibacterium sp. 31-16]MDP5241119.1 GspE/PulE family protein [Uliginosibacterium sp. 31-16]